MIHAHTKIIALISLMLVVLACAVYAGFSYMVHKHKVNLIDERTRAAELDVEKRALKALEDTVRTSLPDREKIEGYILPANAVIDFVDLVESTARGQGVKFTTSNLIEVEVDDIFEELEVTATIEGSFDSVIRMLRILETIPEQSTLTSVAISRQADSQTWVAAVTLRVTKYQ